MGVRRPRWPPWSPPGPGPTARISGSSGGVLQALGCALAVFVPFATLSPLAGLVQWEHCQSTGGVGMGASGGSTSDGDTPEALARCSRKATCQRRRALAAELAAAPLAEVPMGYGPCCARRVAQPTGKTQWHEVKKAGLARLSRSIARAPAMSSPGCASVGWWRSWVISRRSSRVCGRKPCARASARPPRWSGAVLWRPGLMAAV